MKWLARLFSRPKCPHGWPAHPETGRGWRVVGRAPRERLHFCLSCQMATDTYKAHAAAVLGLLVTRERLLIATRKVDEAITDLRASAPPSVAPRQ
jgi:hypothetical protein